MSLVPAQCRAARALLEWSQADLSAKSNVSAKTIADFERGKRGPLVNNLAAIVSAFEAAGVEFTNDGQPGVRLKKREESLSDLTEQIDHMRERVSADAEPSGPASPKKGMQQLRRARNKNELVKLKNRRTKLERRGKN